MYIADTGKPSVKEEIKLGDVANHSLHLTRNIEAGKRPRRPVAGQSRFCAGNSPRENVANRWRAGRGISDQRIARYGEEGVFLCQRT